MKPIAILGAGAFGTSLAIAMARPGRPVLLWARDAAAAERLQTSRRNARHLPGQTFPRALRVIHDLREVPMTAVQVLAIPAQATAAFLAGPGRDLPEAPLVLAAKGIALDTGALQSDIAAGLRGPARLAVLSGPGFAGDIGRGLPTALTLAARDDVLALQLQERLSTADLRLYRSTDMIGVQLGGALKNVIALACGMADGAGLGDSARAALMTRGYGEIVRLGTALGAETRTFAGLSGMGDLALTCGSSRSRNFAAGRAIGAGTAPDPGTVEGIATARALPSLAARHGIDMPVALATRDVLDGSLSIRDAMIRLLNRPLKEED